MASKPDIEEVAEEAYAVFEQHWKDGYYDQLRAARIPFQKIENIIPVLKDLCAVMYLEGKISQLKDDIDGSV